jgi:hypothetical protein
MTGLPGFKAVSGWKQGIFRRGKEVEVLRGGAHRYTAQARPRIDAATAEKNRFRTETSLFQARMQETHDLSCGQDRCVMDFSWKFG